MENLRDYRHCEFLLLPLFVYTIDNSTLLWILIAIESTCYLGVLIVRRLASETKNELAVKTMQFSSFLNLIIRKYDRICRCYEEPTGRTLAR